MLYAQCYCKTTAILTPNAVYLTDTKFNPLQLIVSLAKFNRAVPKLAVLQHTHTTTHTRPLLYTSLAAMQSPPNSHTATKSHTHLWLLIGLVVNLGPVIPVLGLARLRVGDGLGGQEVPVVLQRATLRPAVVDLHLIGVVRSDDQRVQVRELVILWKTERGRGEGGGDVVGLLVSLLEPALHYHYTVVCSYYVHHSCY